MRRKIYAIKAIVIKKAATNNIPNIHINSLIGKVSRNCINSSIVLLFIRALHPIKNCPAIDAGSLMRLFYKPCNTGI